MSAQEAQEVDTRCVCGDHKSAHSRDSEGRFWGCYACGCGRFQEREPGKVYGGLNYGFRYCGD